ncbi:unnamed protein product [Caenorhabditis brenneri]
MSDIPRSKKENARKIAYPALNAIVGKLNLWKREEVVRKYPELEAMSHKTPYHITSFSIDCSDPETYTFSISRGAQDTLWFQFNDRMMYKSRERCSLESAEDSFPTLSADKEQVLQFMASVYLNTPSSHYDRVSIMNLSPGILIKRFTSNFLSISPGSRGSPDYEPLRLFLNQVDNAQEVHILTESLEQMSILTHPLFERLPCTISAKGFDLERWSLLQATGSTIAPENYDEEDTIYYESFMYLAQRFVKTRNIGFECTIRLSKHYTYEIIEEIMVNGVGWQFKPQNDTLAAAYSHYHKEIVLTYDIKYLLHMKVNAITPRSQFSHINGDRLLQINGGILFGSCELRCGLVYLVNLFYDDLLSYLQNLEPALELGRHGASMKQLYPWEPCLPYNFKQLIVNFRTFAIVAKIGNKPKSVMRFNSKEEVRDKLQYLTRNRNTRIKNLTIRGTDNGLGDPQFRHMFSATNIRLFYEGVHSEEFFNIFDPIEMITGLNDLIVSSRESVQHFSLVSEAINFRALDER